MSTITTINPATEEEIRTYDIMTEREAMDRVEACHAAFLEWRKLAHQERAPHLSKIGQKLRENAEDLAALMTSETGKLLKDGLREIKICAASAISRLASSIRSSRGIFRFTSRSASWPPI